MMKCSYYEIVHTEKEEDDDDERTNKKNVTKTVRITTIKEKCEWKEEERIKKNKNAKTKRKKYFSLRVPGSSVFEEDEF